ncbi:MAG: calcium/sodium antiporter [Myxococcota bacterium]
MDVLLLLAGLALAALGGELFVGATVALGRWLRISAGVVAATFAAFATSAPELSVAINAAWDGEPHIALGDSLGSNVVNIGLILGLALTLGPIRCATGSMRRDFPVALLAPVLTAILAVDGRLSRLDGLLMMGMFGAWLGVTVRDARRGADKRVDVLARSHGLRALARGLAGLVLLFAAGRLVVSGATGIALWWGLEPFVIGAIIVSVGTSVPELATTVLSRWRGHDEVGLGTVLGSNIFNNLFIVGVAATIHPPEVALARMGVALAFGALMVVISYPPSTGVLGRRRGWLLLALYVAFVGAMAQLGPGPDVGAEEKASLAPSRVATITWPTSPTSPRVTYAERPPPTPSGCAGRTTRRHHAGARRHLGDDRLVSPG